MAKLTKEPQCTQKKKKEEPQCILSLCETANGVLNNKVQLDVVQVRFRFS